MGEESVPAPVSIDVSVSGIDGAIAKAERLIAALKTAKSLADDLAEGLRSLEVDVE